MRKTRHSHVLWRRRYDDHLRSDMLVLLNFTPHIFAEVSLLTPANLGYIPTFLFPSL